MIEKIMYLVSKELKDYLFSIKYYMVLALYLFVSGYSISNYVSAHNTTNIEGVFPNILLLIIVFVPIMCVVSINKEYKHDGYKIITSSPTTNLEIIASKFISIYILSCLALGMNIVQLLLVRFIDVISYRLLASTFLGFIILLFGLIALNLFFATLTRNPYLNYGIAFVCNVIIFLMSYFIEYIPGFLSGVYAFVSLFTDIKSFWLIGKASIYPLIHSLTIGSIFLYLSVMLSEKRWHDE